jgi:hypothetical protein
MAGVNAIRTHEVFWQSVFIETVTNGWVLSQSVDIIDESVLAYTRVPYEQERNASAKRMQDLLQIANGGGCKDKVSRRKPLGFPLAHWKVNSGYAHNAHTLKRT